MTDPVDIPAVEVRVNGAVPAPEFLAALQAVTVEEELAALTMFTLVLSNWDPETLRVTWSDSDLLAVGNRVDIELGLLGALRPAMTGEITGIEPSFTGNGATVTVRGYDHGHRLGRQQRTRTFSGQTDGAIATRIAREAGLGAAVTATAVELDHVVQANQTDLDFLRRRAALIGFEVFVRDQVLHFRPPDLDAEPVAVLTVGRELVEFAARLTALDQFSARTVRGWDVRAKEPVVGNARPVTAMDRSATSGPAAVAGAFPAAQRTSVDQPVQNQAEADARTRGLFAAQALHYVEGDAECDGDARLHAGTVVEVRGAGSRFSGRYYLTAATHELTVGEPFRSRLTLRRNAA